MNNLDLSPTSIEKKKLRAHGVRIASIHLLGINGICEMLGVSKIRAMELSALSEFQSLPSIGPRFAADLIAMGFYSLEDLRNENGAKLTDRYEKQIGVWVDPCLEDQFRLVVHYARHPAIHKNWWDFTVERKAYREKHGYPSDRPTKAWHELPQFKPANRVSGKSKKTRDDVVTKVKAAAHYIRKHFAEAISLKQLAREAGLSAFHLQRQFKKVYEKTPAELQTHLRLKQASRLLKRTGRPVHLISRQCGFESESAFIRAFRRELQITPLQYRQKDAKVFTRVSRRKYSGPSSRSAAINRQANPAHK